jgi:hypothetical protein
MSPEFDDAGVEELLDLLLAQEKEFWVVTKGKDGIVIIRGSPPFELVDLIAETFGLV